MVLHMGCREIRLARVGTHFDASAPVSLGLSIAPWDILDKSNVGKAFNCVRDKADFHRGGPHQTRQTCASLLLQAGEPIT